MRFVASLLYLLIYTNRCNSSKISVSDNGTDSWNCLNGIAFCRTVDYVMQSLSNYSYSSTSVTVTVFNDQYVMESNFILTSNLTLLIQGVRVAFGQKPNIKCSDFGRISFTSAQGSVSVQGLAFKQCSGPHGYGLNMLSFHDVTITDSKGIGIINTTFIAIVSCDFSFAQPYSGEASLVISHAQAGTILISDCTFNSKCTGSTALWVTNGNVQIHGNVTIANSTGYLGGALRLTRSQVAAVGNATVSFVNNFAQYGSAVYMEDISCSTLNTPSGALSVQIINSKHSCVFINNPTNLSTCPSHTYFLYSFGNSSNCSVSTSATSLSVQLGAKFAVIPGKDIVLNLLVADYFQNRVTCDGAVYITQQYGAMTYCNNPADSTHLSCPLYVPQKQLMTLASAVGWNSTLQVQSAVEPTNTSSSNISVTFICGASGEPNASVSFQLQRCPSFIMQFNNTTHRCECITPSIGGENYMCSVNYGVACIRSGYWKGWDRNQSVVLPCLLPCKPSGPPCPLTTDASFHLLDEQPDNQCSGNKAGLLCSTKCKDGYYLSFPPPRCLLITTCSLGYSFGLLTILVTFEFTKVIIIFVVVSNKLGAMFGSGGGRSRKSLGVGYFFGSLFYMAAIGRLPILSLPQFYVLRWIVETFRTITHLPLDVLGEIKWCFFPSFGALGIFTTQYLGPAVAVTMLMAVYILVCICPKAISKFHPSPMQSISLLILFTFWSLAATSINILQYTEVGNDIRVHLQPDLPYLTGLHLPLAIIASVILVFLIFPLVTFLMFSPFMWRCVNLSKFKPFLDEFQSCYRKSYRWYPAIYFLAWLVIVFTGNLAPYLTVYSVVFFVLCVFLALFQPYEVRWLNTVDMLLLLDLLVMTLLLLGQTVMTTENVLITGLVYILVLVPLLFIGIGIIVLFATQCGCKNCFGNKRVVKKETTKDVELPVKKSYGNGRSEDDDYCREQDSSVDY